MTQPPKPPRKPGKLRYRDIWYHARTAGYPRTWRGYRMACRHLRWATRWGNQLGVYTVSNTIAAGIWYL